MANVNGTETIEMAILKRRAAIIDRLLRTDEGREVTRLDAAYTVLTGQPPPPWQGAGPVNVTLTEMPESKVRPNGSAPSARKSLRVQVLELLEEGPRRWTHDELAVELERRGTELTGSGGDRKSSLRTAVWTLAKRGDASKAEGAFWAAKYDDQLRPQDDEEANDEEVFADIDPHQFVRLSGEVI